MVVNEQADNPAAAVTFHSPRLAATLNKRLGYSLPISGDMTALTLAHRETRGTRRLVAGGWLQRSPAAAALYCGHGPMDACRCTLVRP